jgi:NTE family protein
MVTAFVLSGGGSLGAVQVGMLQALHRQGAAPDMLVGTSAGALNAAYIASHGMSRESLDDLASCWQSSRRRDLFPFDPLRHALAVIGGRPSLFSDRGVGRTLEKHLAIDRLEDAGIPLYVIATDLLSGTESVLHEGDARSAVLASVAIPGLLPPVEREGQTLVDGSMADNAGISVAVEHGADRVFVLPTGYACALKAPPRGAAGIAMHAVTVFIQQRLIADVALFQERVELNVLPPLCPLDVSALDFGHGRELIRRAYAASMEWIDEGGFDRPEPERFLSLHSHGPHSSVANRAAVRGRG